MTKEIIVYRNPLEQQFWDFWADKIWIVILLILLVPVIFWLIGKFCDFIDRRHFNG